MSTCHKLLFVDLDLDRDAERDLDFLDDFERDLGIFLTEVLLVRNFLFSKDKILIVVEMAAVVETRGSERERWWRETQTNILKNYTPLSRHCRNSSI